MSAEDDMAKALPYGMAALVVGILTTAPERDAELRTLLEKHFGPVELTGPREPFSYTDYYDSEMGGQPQRYVMMFHDLIDPSTLADIKTLTNRLEQEFMGPSGRTVNIDPGYINLSSFVLATCKDRAHRIPLRDGIYAELTMIYEDKDFHTFPWTYADYASEGMRTQLKTFRNIYRKLLRERG